jgi:alpha-beta hydrolase superfamily lysophospholipase
MGSYVTQSYLFAHDDVAAAVLSGSSLNTGPLVSLGRAVARFEAWRLGRRGRSWLLQRLSFGEFARTIKGRKTDFDWLSRDPTEVDAYIRDPLCGFDATAGLWSDMLQAFRDLEDPANVSKIRAGLPLLIMSGGHDPVNERGPGFERLKALYVARGMTDLTAKLYPEARHELLNETNRDQVTEDLRVWLDRVTGAEAA